MYVRGLEPRVDTDCPPGYVFYVCNTSEFIGCCAIDPCALENYCPLGLSTAASQGPGPTTVRSTSTSTKTATYTTWTTGKTISSNSEEPTATIPSEVFVTVPAPTSTAAPGSTEPSKPITPTLTPTSGSASSSEAAGAGAGSAGADQSLGFPVGAIVGILCTFFVIVICAAVWYWRCWRPRHSQPTPEVEERDPGWDDTVHLGLPAGLYGDGAGRWSGDRYPPPPFAYSATAANGRSGGKPDEDSQPSLDAKAEALPPHPANSQAVSNSRWETPDDVRGCSSTTSSTLRTGGVRSIANSDMVSPVSPDSHQSSQFGDKYDMRESYMPSSGALVTPMTSTSLAADNAVNAVDPWTAAAAAGGLSRHPSQTREPSPPPHQLDSIPKFELEGMEPKYELDGKEIRSSPPDTIEEESEEEEEYNFQQLPQSQPQQQQDPSASSAEEGGLRPPPLRLPSRGPERHTRPLTWSNPAGAGGLASHGTMTLGRGHAHSRSVAGGGRGPREPGRILQQAAAVQDRHRATLRATPYEIENEIHAGSWSQLGSDSAASGRLPGATPVGGNGC